MFVNAGVFGKHGAVERYRDTRKIICLARSMANHLLPVINKNSKPNMLNLVTILR